MGGLTDNVRGTPRTLDSNMRTPVEERRRREEEIATSQNLLQEKRVNLKTQTDQRHVIKQCDQSAQTGGDQGDEQRDDEDEERDQEKDKTYSEEEESDSEEEESKQTGRKRKKKYHQKNRTSNRQIQTVDQCEINPTPPGTIRLGFLNVQSMNKKENVISELIKQNKLDLLLLNETWLKRKKLKVLHKASPKGFKAHYQVRPGKKRGGGVANLFLKALQRKPKSSDSSGKKIKTTTFEFVVTELQHDDWNQPVLIINLYHPPGNSKEEFRKFLNEFQSLLDEVENYSSFIVTGDFNIHVNKVRRSNNKDRRSYTDEFYHVWPLYNLTQHVEEPTHEAGNTLDLVLTRNVEVSGLFVQDDGVSDHYTVYFYAKPKDTTDKTEENENEEQKPFRETEE
ncbi:nucleolin-like [Acanthopagrus latus]|uniref:nucleolin-like n=1 Tax=Acanthopagrus latus TaxID=8177 RepID=UPI00187BDF39|nr:nucleolin-like [Acanthopagrus latus]